MKSPDQFLAEQPGPSTAWRQGRKVPLNVYEGERAVCQCHTAGDAERIVTAVNNYSAVQLMMDSIGRAMVASMPVTRLAALEDLAAGEKSPRGNNDWPLYALSAWLSDFVDLYEERPSDDAIDAAYFYWRRDQSPQEAATALRQVASLRAADIVGQVVADQITALDIDVAAGAPASGPSVTEMRALWDFVVGERDRLEITCVETIYQTDRVAVAATEFVQGCIDRVGYGKYADEDEDFEL